MPIKVNYHVQGMILIRLFGLDLRQKNSLYHSLPCPVAAPTPPASSLSSHHHRSHETILHVSVRRSKTTFARFSCNCRRTWQILSSRVADVSPISSHSRVTNSAMRLFRVSGAILS